MRERTHYKMGIWLRTALLLCAASGIVSACCTQEITGGVTPSNDAGLQLVPSLAVRIAEMPRGIPRKPGPGLQESMEAAKAASDACAERGAFVSVLIADSDGDAIVLLSGDGAGVRSQLIAQTKVAIVHRYGMASGDVEKLAKSDPSIIAEATADPDIGVLRGGGFPVIRDGEMLGAVAVSGATLARPGLDEMCAKIAVDMLEADSAEVAARTDSNTAE